MANGLPNGSGGWVDNAVKVITQLGFPIVVAGVLLWYLLTRFETNMEAITARMAQNGEMARQLVVSNEKLLLAEEKQFQETQAQTKAVTELVETLQALAQRRVPAPPPP